MGPSLVLHRCRGWPAPFARAHLASIPFAISLQRPSWLENKSKLPTLIMQRPTMPLSVSVTLPKLKRDRINSTTTCTASSTAMPNSVAVHEVFQQEYHWSLMQTEYERPEYFRSSAALQPLYEEISRQAVLCVKAANVRPSSAKKSTPQLAQESALVCPLSLRVVSNITWQRLIKIYDKFKRVLRIEIITNDASFFKHYRKV